MIKVEGVKKSFKNPQANQPDYQILHGISFELKGHAFVSITGRSGSGKSTLLYSMSTLDSPTAGRVLFDGVDAHQLSELDLHQFRNLQMGFIFQFHYLLPELTALENVLMPARRTGRHQELTLRAQDLLSQFGLNEKLDRLPKEMSGGEQQRVAIARALIMSPKYIFADEPTGNLDSANGMIVMDILKSMTRMQGATVIYVTHDPDFAALADHRIRLVDGLMAE
jgi:lipoprotein-releasing system ATP-binding protein